jgi:pyridoxine 4-dehydrogenase
LKRFPSSTGYGSHVKTALGMGYGDTEKLTKKMLQRARETQGDKEIAPVVATKFTPVPWRTTVQSVVDACEQSRLNLGVDQIDLYQIHMPDIVQPLRFLGKDKAKDSIYWDGLAECYNRGLVKNVGVCNYGPTLVAQCQEALAKRGVPLASNQIGYSLLGRHNGAQETLDKCNELGVKVLAYYPFAMGLLTGKYSNAIKESGDESLTKFKKTSLETKDLERYAKGDGITVPEGGIEPLLTTMSAIAENRGKTIAQVALNYIISKGAIPIPGCRTVSQLEDNIGAMGWRLSVTEVNMLELEADKLGFGFDGAGFKRTSEKFVGYGVEKWSLD